jgi:hypothetical protein
MRKIIVGAGGALFAPAVFATEVVISIVPRALPTMSEIGLGAMVVAMAAAAGWVLRKRK